MSRTTRLNRTVRRAVERQLEKIEPTKPLLRSKAAKILIFAIGIPGILAGVLSLLPRVTVTISDPVDAEDPFSSSVTVVNTGYIPLNRVLPILALGQIVTTGKTPNMNWVPDYTTRYIRSDVWRIQHMNVDDRQTLALNDVWGVSEKGSLVYADIAVVVQYEMPIPLIHWRREKIVPFVTRKQGNGHFYWYAKFQGEVPTMDNVPLPINRN